MYVEIHFQFPILRQLLIQYSDQDNVSSEASVLRSRLCLAYPAATNRYPTSHALKVQRVRFDCQISPPHSRGQHQKVVVTAPIVRYKEIVEFFSLERSGKLEPAVQYPLMLEGGPDNAVTLAPPEVQSGITRCYGPNFSTIQRCL